MELRLDGEESSKLVVPHGEVAPTYPVSEESPVAGKVCVAVSKQLEQTQEESLVHKAPDEVDFASRGPLTL